MPWTREGLETFANFTVSLRSFPLFCLYLALAVPGAFLWTRLTKPFSLRPVLVVYNFLCCILSIISLLGLTYGMFYNQSAFQKTDSPALKPFFYIYWITKNLELLDTVFMVLRHRTRQISFLHVYHHATMLLLSDAGYHHYSWPCIAFFLALNSFVHVVLYLYYGLAALNTDNPPAWRKRVTQLQILQFLIGFVHASFGYAKYGYCVYGILYGVAMTALFSNFYYQAYVRKSKHKQS